MGILVMIYLKIWEYTKTVLIRIKLGDKGAARPSPYFLLDNVAPK